MKFLLMALFFSLGCSNLESTDDKGSVGLHGGQLKKGKHFNLEVVPNEKGVQFFTYDKNNRLLKDAERLELEAKYAPIGSKEEHSYNLVPVGDHYLGVMDQDIRQQSNLRVKVEVEARGHSENFGFLIQ